MDDNLKVAIKALSSLSMGIQCPICLETFKNPIRSICGHNFCKMCIDKHLNVNMDESSSSQSPSTRRLKLCPLCKTKLHKRSVMPDESVTQQVELIIELEKNFSEAVAGVFDLDEAKKKVSRTDREAPRQTPEVRTLKLVSASETLRRQARTRTLESREDSIENYADASRGVEDDAEKVGKRPKRESRTSNLVGKKKNNNGQDVFENLKQPSKSTSEPGSTGASSVPKEGDVHLSESGRPSNTIHSDSSEPTIIDKSQQSSDQNVMKNRPVEIGKTNHTSSDSDRGSFPKSVVVNIVSSEFNGGRSNASKVTNETTSSLLGFDNTKEKSIASKAKAAPGNPKVHPTPPSQGSRPSLTTDIIKATPVTSVSTKPRIPFFWGSSKPLFKNAAPKRVKIKFVKLGKLCKPETHSEAGDEEMVEIESNNLEVYRDYIPGVSPSQEVSSRSILEPLAHGSTQFQSREELPNVANPPKEEKRVAEVVQDEEFLDASLSEVDKSIDYKASSSAAEKRFLEIASDCESDVDVAPVRQSSKRQRRTISSSSSDNEASGNDFIKSTQEMESELQKLKEQAARKVTDDDDSRVDESSSDYDMFSLTPQKESTLFKNTLKRQIATPASTAYSAKTSTPATKTAMSMSPRPYASPLRERNSTSLLQFVSSQNSDIVDSSDDVDVRSLRVISTGLSKQKRDELARFLTTFKIATSRVLDENVTHVVVDVNSANCALRTLKYMQALSMGKPIVSIQWVTLCLESQRIIPASIFEPKDFRGEPGPQRSRICFLNGLGESLLKNYSIFLMGDFSNEVPKTDLESIIKRLGGKIVNNLTDLSVVRRDRTRLTVVDNAAASKGAGSSSINSDIRTIFPTLRVAVVSKDWILDTVGAFAPQNILPYIQGGVKVEELSNAGYNVSGQ